MSLDWQLINAERKSPHGEVDRSVVEAYKFNPNRGPRVGALSLEHKRFANEKFRAKIRAERIPEGEYAGCVQFSISVESPKDPKWESREGFIILRVDSPGEGYYAQKKYKGKESAAKRHDPEAQYGNDPQTETPSKVFVENMVAGSSSSDMIWGKSHKPSEFKFIGSLLHQIAVEWSFLMGCEGRVQLQVSERSLGFHERFGFLAQDVYNPDGTLHHWGKDIHKAIAIDRMESADEFENNPKYKDIYTKDRFVRLYGETKRSFDDRDTAVYMYLPPEIIQRESKRIAENPHLSYSAATIQALLDQYAYRMEANKHKAEIGRYGPIYYKELAAGMALLKVGDREEAKPHLENALKYFVENAQKSRGYFNCHESWKKAAEICELLEDQGRSKKMWEEAAEAALASGLTHRAADYFSRIGGEYGEQRARALYREY